LNARIQTINQNLQALESKPTLGRLDTASDFDVSFDKSSYGLGSLLLDTNSQDVMTNHGGVGGRVGGGVGGGGEKGKSNSAKPDTADYDDVSLLFP
jgi:hypothetical protein